ncbi:hypothetical protein BDV40DRAFT_262350 [Aspergillus tamarii]|uniref:Uncharacterized protein n=1 Tax=Aspergillus tamarii TaxID=41984 RepID=A0A5N6UYB7_ASPTM|nr:hypothetical protein BDV40DRAFT_262350 [Aspergillus tamarii]
MAALGRRRDLIDGAFHNGPAEVSTKEVPPVNRTGKTHQRQGQWLCRINMRLPSIRPWKPLVYSNKEVCYFVTVSSFLQLKLAMILYIRMFSYYTIYSPVLDIFHLSQLVGVQLRMVRHGVTPSQ